MNFENCRITKDVTVEGYAVLKDSMALTNLLAFMRDPQFWDKRFLEIGQERYVCSLRHGQKNVHGRITRKGHPVYFLHEPC